MHVAEHLVRLSEVFPLPAVVLGLGTEGKEAVIRRLVRHLVEIGRIAAAAESAVVDAIVAREGLSSTGVGNGVAVPHCRTSAVDEFVGALGLEPAGLRFDSLDGGPVFAVFVLVAPLDRRDQYFELLGRITAIGADKGRRFVLQAARTPADAHGLLRQLDRA